MKVGFFLTVLAVVASPALSKKDNVAPRDSVDYKVFGAPIKKAAVDAQIAAALKEVSVERIKANIARL